MLKILARHKDWVGGFLLATALAALYSSLSLDAVLRHGLDWPMRLRHLESVSLSTYGKWGLNPPHRYGQDAMSGVFPAYYNYLSDTLLNAAASLSGVPSATLQSTVWSPLLGFLFALGCFAFLRRVLESGSAALLATALIAFGTNSRLHALIDRGLNGRMDFLLHVPFHALPLANAQAAGWVLFVPAVSALYLAVNRPATRWAVWNGVLLGLLFHVHTLTFIHVALIHQFYLVSRILDSGIRGTLSRRRFRIFLAGMGIVAALFLTGALRAAPFSLPFLGALWAMAMGLCFYADTNRAYYWGSYPISLLLALPYLVHLAVNVKYLQVPLAREPDVATLLDVFLFFFPLWIASAFAYRSKRRELLIWGGAILVSSLFLGLNRYWNWPNHPYRFLIHLIFPLGILAAVGLPRAPRWILVPVSLWLLAIVLLNAQAVLLRRTLLAGNIVEDAANREFYERVREFTQETARNESGASILLPPEFNYPDSLVSMARILSYSSLPGFLPDFRYILQPERHLNRLGVFCSLFPGYPLNEPHSKNESCKEPLEPSLTREGFAIRDPRLRGSTYAIYGIRYVGSIDTPLEPAAAKGPNLRAIAATPGGFFSEVVPQELPGVARFERGEYDARGFHAKFNVGQAGAQRLILGGRGLGQRVARASVNGVPLGTTSASGNWVVHAVDLPASEHSLDLQWTDAAAASWKNEQDFLYFAAVIRETEFSKYVAAKGAQPLPQRRH